MKETLGRVTGDVCLHLKDKNTNDVYLIDTGAGVSVYPRCGSDNSRSLPFSLAAANGTKINIFGMVRKKIDFGFCEPLEWDFILADVQYPVLGGDALKNFHLLPDLAAKRLYKLGTGDKSDLGVVEPASVNRIDIIKPDTPFANLLLEYPRVIGLKPQPPLRERGVYHYIRTSGPPLAQRARPLAPLKEKIARAEFRKWMALGICQESDSPWASPIHMVLKSNGEWRVCGDYRRVNSVTEPDKFPIPRVLDFKNNLHGKTIFTKLDLERAFHQIPVAPEDIPKTALITPFGLFEFNVMTFGFRNAPSTMQRYVFKALGDLDFVFVYIDDVFIASSSIEEHETHLRIVLERLEKFHLKLNLDKCEFAVSETTFLGYFVCASGYKPCPEKVKAILDFPKPKTVYELRKFLGVLNCYH